MNLHDYIEIGATLVGFANCLIVLLIRIEVMKLRIHVTEKFLSKDDFRDLMSMNHGGTISHLPKRSSSK